MRLTYEPRGAAIPANTRTGEDWRSAAKCLDVDDAELWFPVGHGPEAMRQTAQAKAVCRGCPVVEACLKWAMDSREDDGIWGGLTGDERRLLRRRNGAARNRDRTPAEHGTDARYRAHIRAGEPLCDLCIQARALVRATRREQAS